MVNRLLPYQNEMLIRVLDDIVEERARQDKIWGEQNHNPLDWIAILIEENGEMSQAALRLCRPDLHDPSGEYDLPKQHLVAAYRKELVQVAAVAVAMIESLDREKWDASEVGHALE